MEDLKNEIYKIMDANQRTLRAKEYYDCPKYALTEDCFDDVIEEIIELINKNK